MKSGILIHPEELTKKWIDRMADRGVSIMGLHPIGGRDANDSLAQLLELQQTSDFRALIDYAISRGMEIEYEMHAVGYLMPRELFATHPDYFRMDEDGQRNPDRNLCVSNAQGLALLGSRARELAKSLYRSRPVFYFWMDDTRGKICRCPACRRHSASEQQLIALNAMIREIRREIPTARMAYLAYLDAIEVPHGVTPEAGVFLEYAPIEKAKPVRDPVLVAQELRATREQLAYFGKQDAKVLEYWLDNSLFSGWKKPPKAFAADAEAIRADIAEYRSLGFDTVATFGCFLGEDYEALYGEPDITPFTDACK